jgi:Phosphotransferase enzyme family
MNPALRERVARVTGAQPVAWAPRFGGYAANERWSVKLDDGRRVFVKHAPAELLATFLREEYRVYTELRAPFMPQLVGFDDDGDRPLLMLEDLAGADWPPPWTAERIDAVRATLDELHALDAPARLPRPGERIVNLLRGWDIVADDPAPFLSLGLVDAEWLERSLPALLTASHAAPVDGEQLIHFDVRSDNVCFARGRAILVDWNLASRGNGDFDLAFWLPSLAAEGGPHPWELLPDAPELAALYAGFFACRAGLPPPETAPAVRPVQLAQFVPALAWARRELAL